MTDLSKVLAYLQELMKSRLFGRVIISFTDGKVTTIKTEQTVTLDKLKIKKSQ